MNNRRKLVIALGAGALAAPLGSFAQQQGKVWRIGILWERKRDLSSVDRIDGFKAGMRELDYVEGRDYTIEYRFLQDGNLARLPALAAELLALKVDLIVSSGTPSAVAAHNASREIPILITTVGDPVSSGLAISLSRPGGNVTGLTSLSKELYTKRLDLLRQILPSMRRVGFLYNPDNDSGALALKQFESDCGKLQFTPVLALVRKAQEIAAAFNILQRDKAQGVIVTSSSTNLAWRENIIEQAAKHRLPAIYGQSIFSESGGLTSYAADYPDLIRRAAAYAVKIFKGAKPGDLPIEQPTKFELVVNMKTANALGIKIPGEIMLQATRVIE
jgi:putative ABC transport system substrate-binding protein